MDDCFQFAFVHVSVGVLVWECWCGNVGVGMSVRECWCGRDRVDDCVQFAFVHVSVGVLGMLVWECRCGNVGVGVLVWECWFGNVVACWGRACYRRLHSQLCAHKRDRRIFCCDFQVSIASSW